MSYWYTVTFRAPYRRNIWFSERTSVIFCLFYRLPLKNVLKWRRTKTHHNPEWGAWPKPALIRPTWVARGWGIRRDHFTKSGISVYGLDSLIRAPPRVWKVWSELFPESVRSDQKHFQSMEALIRIKSSSWKNRQSPKKKRI